MKPTAALGFAIAALLSLLASASAVAADTQVAVAANFTAPAREIAQAFTARTGHHAILSFGSSGQFYTQITHGAPYEVFLSADADRPRRAEQDGVAGPGTRFTYAVGRLVLWSSTPGLVDDKGAVLAKGGWEKLAIAEMGFVALSQVVDDRGGSRWLVPAGDHDPIDQQAILLKTGDKSPAARAFMAFLKGPESRAIIRRYGYEVR